MTHIVAVFRKSGLPLRLGKAVQQAHELARFSEPQWCYWYNGYTAWTPRGKLDVRSALPQDADFYQPLLHAGDLSAVLTTWGCFLPESGEPRRASASVHEAAEANLPDSLPASTLAVSNKGDFSDEARRGFERQDIVAAAPSGFEIGYFLQQRYAGSEARLLKELETRSLVELLSWVKTSYAVVIGGHSCMVLFGNDANRRWYCIEDDELLLAATVEPAVVSLSRQLRPQRAAAVEMLPVGEMRVSRRACGAQ